jgi:hypothetical protein
MSGQRVLPPPPLPRHRRIVAPVLLALVLFSAAVPAWFYFHQGAAPIGTHVPDEGRLHVSQSLPATYRHSPPSSGPHYEDPVAAGFYEYLPLPPGTYIHNLEHGFIVVLYRRKDTTPALVQELRDFYIQMEQGSTQARLVIAPYDAMAHPITALAWTWEMPIDAFDAGKLRQFYDAHRDRAPEATPNP